MLNIKPLNEDGCIICTRNEKSNTNPNYCIDCYVRYESRSWPLDDLIPLSYHVKELAYSLKAKDYSNSFKKDKEIDKLSDLLFGYLDKHYTDIKKCIKEIFNVEIDIITYVPSERDVNYLERIILDRPETKNYPIEKLLTIENSTGVQKNKELSERLNLNKDKFNIKKKVKNKNIIIIDDVYTTGATINSAAWTLKNKGEANKLFGLVFSRTVKDELRKDILKKDNIQIINNTNNKYELGKYLNKAKKENNEENNKLNDFLSSVDFGESFDNDYSNDYDVPF